MAGTAKTKAKGQLGAAARDLGRLESEAERHAPPLTTRAARWLWPVLLLAGLSALGFVGLLADEIEHGHAFRLDERILLALRRPGELGTPIGPAWMTQSAIDLSALGGFTLQWLLGGATVGYLVLARRRAEAAWLAASVLGASVLNAAMKEVLKRPRPELVPHLAKVSNASFPSGHAMISAAVYLTLAAMLAESHRRASGRAYIMAAAGALVVLIGSSRVYLGVHWPSDVLAGWCLGAVWALAVFAANRALRRRVAHQPVLAEMAKA
ncbi:phosphatase PAP2 family protein [Phenylobacterium sp.]|uniref:phosphatase PAP2 family protein n=1 Tax=Phenylobacterium sp. TaxID=1871053 RepID=UPI0025DA2DE3|nr:phosphatase PAP2 family protein [Phenylobacterium sp.]